MTDYKIRVFFAWVCVTLCLCGCGNESEITPTEGKIKELHLADLEEVPCEHSTESTTVSVEEKDSFLEQGCGYSYEQLPEGEQLWYTDIAAALGSMTDKQKLSEEGFRLGATEDCVDKIFQCVLSDHPELFYVEGYTYTKYTKGDKIVAIEFSGTYEMDKEKACTRRAEMEAAVEPILAKLNTFTDDYDKIKYAYETIVLETEYNEASEDNQNIYSVFVGHASVCQGYAKAFQYLMNRTGILCSLVQGKVKESGDGHAWNLVKSNGDFYYVDATWGDIFFNNDEDADGQNKISYDYLCVTSKQLFETHESNALFDLPDCVAQKDNYFVRENAFFTEYDTEKMDALMEQAWSEGRQSVALRCSDRACYETMCKALLDDREIFDYLRGYGISTFVYSTDDKQLTMTFFLMTSTQ